MFLTKDCGFKMAECSVKNIRLEIIFLPEMNLSMVYPEKNYLGVFECLIMNFQSVLKMSKLVNKR